MLESVETAESGAARSRLAALRSWKRVFLNLSLLALGSAIYAVGLNGVLVPNRFLSGGIIGISLVIHYLVPKFNTGLIYFILNIPLILLGWFTVSRRFILYTFFGMVAFSLSAAYISPSLPAIKDPILAAVFAGIICGAGQGIILRSQGSGGGLDVLAVYLYVKMGFRMGTTTTAVNAIIIATAAFCFDLQVALYSLIYVYTSGKITNSVLTGFNQRKSVLIISDQPQAIADQILSRLKRGVTFLHGVGGYSGENKEVIFSIITLTELAKMKEIVFDIDPKAFMVVNDTLEVIGKRHGTRKVY